MRFKASRVYEYAIDQFIAWYCSELRLAFYGMVVVGYRMYLESRHLAANTINQQLAAVRRLAHEAADAGLLSPELAAGISRVKGVKQLGFRSGNWLSAEQSSEVLKHAGGDTMRAKRDYAMLAMLFGCGFRRSELVGLELDDIQMRQGHWAVVDAAVAAEVSGLQHDVAPETEVEDRATQRRTFCGENPSDIAPRTRKRSEAGHRATQPRIARMGGVLPAHRSERCVGRTRWLDQTRQRLSSNDPIETAPTTRPVHPHTSSFGAVPIGP